MNTFQLSCFLAVADTLNFARAAEQLHVTQPAVTQQIHSLERELNVQLFKRTKRTVRLTGEGGSFLNDARRMVALAERAKRRFENPQEREFQVLALGCYSYTHLFLLAPVLRQLVGLYPNLHPALRVVPSHYLYKMLEEDDVDAVIGFREPRLKKIAAVYRELSSVPVVCVCSPDHPLAARGTVTIEDLRREKLVLLDPARSQGDMARVQAQLMDGRAFSDFYFCESPEAATVLVQAGFGASVIPDLFTPPDAPLVQIPIEHVDPVSFGIYYKSAQGNAPLKSLVRLLTESGTAHTSGLDKKDPRSRHA